MRRGPWRTPRRLLPIALMPVAVYATLWLVVSYSLGAAGCRGQRRNVRLLNARPAAGGAPGAEVLVESDRLALPPSSAPNRFDGGWEPRDLEGGRALAPSSGAGRLLVVSLGEEVARTLTLDLPPGGLPVPERLVVRTGDRELARTVLPAAAAPLRVRLPEDLSVGQVPLDLRFEPAAPLSGSPLPAILGATLTPALAAGVARVEDGDVVMTGNCLVYLACRLSANEALVGTFVPPADARPGQRFDLSVERLDGTPIRRFGWRPSFWNRLRGARRFELPLRNTLGPVRVRLISRAADGRVSGTPAAAVASDPHAGRWHALGLVNVSGEILTPGQGQ